MNNADLIVRILVENGVTHGFGVPSGNVLPLIEAMRAGGIEFVLTAHEGSAAFAADVMGRMTGRPGFCVATLGPGATNLTTGVGSAWLDRSPMIALTCTLDERQSGRRLQMQIDHHALFKAITKASLPLRSGTIAATVAEAVRIALCEPQGPVHLDLPEDVSLAPAAEVPLPVAASDPAAAVPDGQARARARELLAGATRPVAVIGASAMRMRDPGLLRRFVERNGMPFATTTMAKGMIDEDHPLSVGCIERACRQVQRRFLQGADLIVGLGYDTVEVEYEAWIGAVPLLHVDIEAVDIDATVGLAGALVGDLDACLAGLEAVPPAANGWAADALARHRAVFAQALRPAADGFAPHAAIDVVRRRLPRDGVLAFDVGAHTHQIASQWTVHEPRRFLITNGWSSMGFGLPAAIAAKLARPDLPVVCMLGDGCFQMTCGEVATARRLGLCLPIVVLDDCWLSLIRIKQQKRQFAVYGSAVEQGMGAQGGHLAPPAHYFGVPAVAAVGPDELDRALAAALRAAGPTVIEAKIDPAHYDETVFD